MVWVGMFSTAEAAFVSIVFPAFFSKKTPHTTLINGGIDEMSGCLDWSRELRISSQFVLSFLSKFGVTNPGGGTNCCIFWSNSGCFWITSAFSSSNFIISETNCASSFDSMLETCCCKIIQYFTANHLWTQMCHKICAAHKNSDFNVGADDLEARAWEKDCPEATGSCTTCSCFTTNANQQCRHEHVSFGCRQLRCWKWNNTGSEIW